MSHQAFSQNVGRAAPILDVAHDTQTSPPSDLLSAMRGETGISPTALAGAYMRLAFGRGRISFADFVKLRLFDQDFHAGASLNGFVGQRRNRDICVTANYRHDWLGMLSNKMASVSYLAAYGLPTIPVCAVFAPKLKVDHASVMATRGELEAFLLSSAPYPLFGKPIESMQSLGSIAMKRVHAKDRAIEKTDGTFVSLDDLLTEIETNYHAGYLLQPLMRPAPSVSILCNDKLACVRVITILTERDPEIIRTVFKIPAGSNSADNYWRPGNLLAQIEHATGRILRVTSGSGLSIRNHTHHPDTQAPLVGFQIPDWDAVTALAIEGARLMQHVPLIGWDIACTASGPVVVEMNETPDFFLPQFADRRGMMDARFEDFLAFQAKNADRHRRSMKTSIMRL